LLRIPEKETNSEKCLRSQLLSVREIRLGSRPMLPEEAIMAHLYSEQKHESLFFSIVSTMAGEHLTRGQKALRGLMVLVLFGLMATPILIDMLLH
jgi:hypothetical protein